MICTACLLANAFQPSLLNAIKPTLTVNQFLPAHVHWAIIVPKYDSASPADEKNADQEEKEKKEKGRQDD
jgi:hypothetical protein